MTSFYLVEANGSIFGRKWAYVLPAADSHYGDAPTCPVCNQPIGTRRWLPPYRIELSSADPAKWPDVLWGSAPPFMVSERFRAVWLASGLSGVETFLGPAEVIKLGKRRHDFVTQPPVYFGVELRWNGANLDDAASGAIRRNDACAYHRGSFTRLDTVHLEESSWDGSALFVARGLPGAVIGSEAFAALLVQHTLTGVELWQPKETSYDERRSGLWQVQPQKT